MSGASQRGFTIIEVSLFLAITGLLFLIALIGTGSTIRSVRFSDSGRNLTAFVQRQYDDIINGLNTRLGQETCTAGAVINGGNQAPGTSNCLLIGRLLVFKVGSPNVGQYDVVGTEPANVDYSQSDTALISAFQPKAVTTTGVVNYDIPWDAYISGTKRLSDNQGITGLLLVRSPKSSRVVSYTYKASMPPNSDLSAVVNDPVSNASQTNNFCITNADGQGLPAKLIVNGAPNQQAVQVVFDANSGGNECNGN